MRSVIEPGRREFFGRSLIGALALLSGCKPGRQTDAPMPDGGTLTPEHVAAAERLAGIEYTQAERQMIVETIEGQLAALETRRRFRPDNDLAPATVYDPRRPGASLPGPGPSSAIPSVDQTTPRPSNASDVAFASIRELGRWLRDGSLTSTELTELYLGRLDTHGKALECVAASTRELALVQAREADARLRSGQARGPLDGIPWGAKDLLDTDGIPTTWGAQTHADRVPRRNAEVVERLHRAGAVLVAKLTLGAIAYGDIWAGGRTNSPWNSEEGSSGSSAGSAAATAAGLVGFAIGTETMGSIVSPSMRCGTVGLRPSFGRVSRHGAMALCWSLDKIGALCRTVEDTALVLAAINGHDARDPSSLDVGFVWDGTTDDPRSLAGIKLAYDPAWFEGDDVLELDREVLARLRRLGAELIEIELDDLPYEGLAAILPAEAAAAFEDLTLDDRDDLLTWQDPEAWPNVWRLARFIPAVDLVQADRLRRRVRDSYDELLGKTGATAMISPSFSGPLLLITNFTGHPSLTLRTGFQESATRSLWGVPAEGGAKHRVPHGITLWGRLFDEAGLIRIGRALELELGVWHERPPGLNL
jgi:Asp-tRNA(Asn)/Glu-tRNA(Gln) amidotransferase A subunit family amidase